MPSDRPRFCVMGAGRGGTAMAAHLALMGFDVALWNRSPERLEPIRERGGIELTAPGIDWLPTGEGQLQTVTTDAGEALGDAEIVMVVVPATGHRFVAEQCAPHLREGQVVVLHPGRTGGALEFCRVLHECGCTAHILLAETQTFIYASRAVGPAEARIHGVKNRVPVAALPGYRTREVVEALRVAYPQFVPGDTVLKTGLDNVAVMFHPTVMLFNAARIEDTHGDFAYYLSGITPSVARALEDIDHERVQIGEALGLRATPVRDWLYVSYDVTGRSLHEAIHANYGYKGIMAPTTLNHRYLREDIPCSLIPMISIAEQYGVETPTMRSVVHLGSLLLGQDFWAEGRTVERIGIKGLTVRQVRRLVTDGDTEDE